MSIPAAAAGSNDPAVNSIAQELVFGGKINSRLKILIEMNYFEEMQHYFHDKSELWLGIVHCTRRITIQ